MIHQVTFERSYGTFNIPTHRGTVTIASQPDWESFADVVSVLDPRQIGQLVLSPELITVSDLDLSRIATHRHMIEERIENAKEITQRFPEATLLLGTAAFDEPGEKPRNTLLFIQDGREVGRTYKANPIVKQEVETFQKVRPYEARKPAAGYMSIICSDLVMPPRIGEDVETVLVSSCWSTPSGYPGIIPMPQDQVESYTAYFAGELLDRFDSVQTIIMADRLPYEGQATTQGPYNFVARRA